MQPIPSVLELSQTIRPPNRICVTSNSPPDLGGGDPLGLTLPEATRRESQTEVQLLPERSKEEHAYQTVPRDYFPKAAQGVARYILPTSASAEVL
jgi:hypothetical protein